jgi:hypothetical protein
MQGIELLLVKSDDEEILTIRPEHASSFIVGWPAGRKPEEVATKALASLELRPAVLHSTSWRHSGGEVVLTYIAVVAEETQAPSSWTVERVEHADLARGGATTPPPAIGVAQVLEHALRHLAWLVREDEGIGAALPGWARLLESYVPEPFRALGEPET